MKRLIAALIVLILMISMVFICYEYYLSIYLPGNKIDESAGKQSELIDKIRPDIDYLSKESDDIVGILTADKHTLSNEDESMRDLLAPCRSINNDVAAWIYIPGTNIDYPIMQTDNNDFYLHNGADGQYNYELGCPFLDYRCNRDFSGFNSIVYGHHMENQLMFADIVKYEDEAFMTDHQTGYLVIGTGVHTVRLFSYIKASSTSALYHTSIIKKDRADYLDLIFLSAEYTQDMTIDKLKSNDDVHLILLSTCTFEYNEARGILVGVIE